MSTKDHLDLDTNFMSIFEEYREAEDRDIRKGYFTYGEGSKRPLDFPETFLIRMRLQFGINPYDEEERVPFSLI